MPESRARSICPVQAEGECKRGHPGSVLNEYYMGVCDSGSRSHSSSLVGCRGPIGLPLLPIGIRFLPKDPLIVPLTDVGLTILQPSQVRLRDNQLTCLWESPSPVPTYWR